MKKKLVCGVVGLGLAVAMVACGDAQPEEATAQSTGQSLSIVRASARTRRATGISEWRLGRTGGQGGPLVVDGLAPDGSWRGRFTMRRTPEGHVELTSRLGSTSSSVVLSSNAVGGSGDSASAPLAMHLRADLESSNERAGAKPQLFGQDDGEVVVGGRLGGEDGDGAYGSSADIDRPPSGADLLPTLDCVLKAGKAIVACALGVEGCFAMPAVCPEEVHRCQKALSEMETACEPRYPR